MNIWVDENIPRGKEAFSDCGEVTAFAGRGLRASDIRDADALIVRSVTCVDAALLEGSRVRFVATATIGVDHVDPRYLSERGIGFASAPGCNANSVAEYVVSALTHLERTKGFSPAGKTLGLIGYGHVGKRTAVKARALGMHVVPCDPPLREAGTDDEPFLDLDDLLERSDVVSLHVPLSQNGPHPTYHMADAAFFARLIRPAVLINTCRGEVIREPDLLAALGAGRVRHLVLDVFAGEPRIDPVLCAAADLITPHIAGYSLQGKLNGTVRVAHAFRRFFGIGSEWTPDWPAPAVPEIRYPPASSSPAESASAGDAAFLAHCVAHAYPIREDDRRLRDSLKTPDPGPAFDRLRREYPVRHEFPGFRVTGIPPEKAGLRSQLAALGFQVG